jgi:SAM-dependent methyltransferase
MVRTVHATVGAIAKGQLDLGQFDLIYAAGLYDYLPAPFARALTAKLVRALKPGGQLLLGNFTRGFVGKTYMECFMDWTLIWRTAAELRDLFDGALEGTLHGSIETFADSQGCIGYALATRREFS